MTSDTLKRDYSWSVELIHPLRVSGKSVTEIDIRPPEFDHVIRWGTGEIPATLALLSELSGVSEAALRTLRYPDVDRVMLAFANVIKSTPIITDFEKGSRPLATPKPAPQDGEQPVEVMPGVDDEHDPRFPKVAGPVRRFAPAAPEEPPPVQDDSDVALAAAGGSTPMRRVG